MQQVAVSINMDTSCKLTIFDNYGGTIIIQKPNYSSFHNAYVQGHLRCDLKWQHATT